MFDGEVVKKNLDLEHFWSKTESKTKLDLENFHQKNFFFFFCKKP